MMHMYQVILVVATSIFHAMIATVQWVAVIAFVIEAMMLSAPVSLVSNSGRLFLMISVSPCGVIVGVAS
jgi:hypothetical protein